jgi:hypothetical protein
VAHRLAAALVLLLAGCGSSRVDEARAPEPPTPRETGAPPPAAVEPAPPVSRPDVEIPAGLACLLAAYPEHLCGAAHDAIRWCDSTEMPYDSHVAYGSHDDLLDHADLEDQMALRYPVGTRFRPPPGENFEPGRVRHEPMFKKMYGATPAEVRARLATVQWMPGVANRALRVTKVNDVHDKLRAVSEALTQLPPASRTIAAETSGTFHWRPIKGTERVSAHGFGIAIDVGAGESDYWRWAAPVAGILPYRNRIPLDIVEAFERHGFIWGGKWYHFDTMHFEYRPELLAEPCVDRAP